MIESTQISIFQNEWSLILIKFLINLTFTLILSRLLYFSKRRRTDYLFSFVMISVVVFFLCFTLRKLDLNIGMALGMFAVFAIIRYRTQVIPVKEMTYLFVCHACHILIGLKSRASLLTGIASRSQGCPS